jgi:hypothetical protein
MPVPRRIPKVRLDVEVDPTTWAVMTDQLDPDDLQGWDRLVVVFGDVLPEPTYAARGTPMPIRSCRPGQRSTLAADPRSGGGGLLPNHFGGCWPSPNPPRTPTRARRRPLTSRARLPFSIAMDCSSTARFSCWGRTIMPPRRSPIRGRDGRARASMGCPRRSAALRRVQASGTP